MSLRVVRNMLLLDADGKRIISKYYGPDHNTLTSQQAYEKKLFEKTKNTTGTKDEAEIILFDGLISVYRQSQDLWLYVSGDMEENELLLVSVLTTLYDALDHITKGQLDKKTFLDSIDLAFLAIDELVDGGIVLESDGVALAQRVGVRDDGDTFSDRSISQAIERVRDTVVRALQ
eukprot:TRINITY_DN886_c0_g1_i1.p1 TRINITY_DN886_c0_g1~~TRINITY_DN886_c0_g1_i1.p1  ORF type:complete len:188 (-),score=33.45 TRINITY_DN886_c0_g1_i1:828-1352(-)